MSEKFPGGRRNITYRLNITYFFIMPMALIGINTKIIIVV